jgi:hypothetical protein
MGYVDWGEQVALHDERNGDADRPVEGTLLVIARHVLAISPAIRVHFRIVSPTLGSLDEFDICALVSVPGFMDDTSFRAAA